MLASTSAPFSTTAASSSSSSSSSPIQPIRPDLTLTLTQPTPTHTPISPILANSSFANFDYFLSGASRSSSASGGSGSVRSSVPPSRAHSSPISPVRNSVGSLFSARSPVQGFKEHRARVSVPQTSGSPSTVVSIAPPRPPRSRPITPPPTKPHSSVSSQSSQALEGDQIPVVDTASSSFEITSSPMTTRSSSGRQSVRIVEKAQVNWARPLRATDNSPVEYDDSSSRGFGLPLTFDPTSLPLFGTSSQRTRRLNRSHSPSASSSSSSLPSPTASLPSSTSSLSSGCNSEDEVHTPQPPATPEPGTEASTSRGCTTSKWEMLQDDRRGLGVGILDDEDWFADVVYQPTPSNSGAKPAPDFATPVREVADPFHASPAFSTSTSGSDLQICTPPPNTATSTIPAITSLPTASSINSLSSYASPATLAELRCLRQAAADLADEARRTGRPASFHSDMIPTASDPNPNAIPRSVAGPSRIRRKAVPAVPTELEIPPSSTGQESAGRPSSRSSLDIEQTSTFNGVQNLKKSFYHNHLATMSVSRIDLSPRSLSSTIIPKRTSSRRVVSESTISTPTSSYTAQFESPASSELSMSTSTSGGEAAVVQVKSVPRDWMMRFNLGVNLPSSPSTDSLALADDNASQMRVVGKGKKDKKGKGEEERGYITRSKTLALRRAETAEVATAGSQEVGTEMAGGKVPPAEVSTKHRRGLSRFLGRKKEESVV